MSVTSGSRLHVGRKKKPNQDNYCADDNLGLYVVADGSGGHAAGEVASRTAVEAIAEFIKFTSTEGEISWPYGGERGAFPHHRKVMASAPENKFYRA